MKWVTDKNSIYHIIIGPFKIVVHQHIAFPRDVWFMTCIELNTYDCQLKNPKNLDEAKTMALVVCSYKLTEKIKDYEHTIGKLALLLSDEEKK